MLQLLSLWSTCRLFQILGLAELSTEATKFDIAALRRTADTPFCDDTTMSSHLRPYVEMCGVVCGWLRVVLSKLCLQAYYNGTANIRGPVRGALELLA